jgi:hypothetical protein
MHVDFGLTSSLSTKEQYIDYTVQIETQFVQFRWQINLKLFLYEYGFPQLACLFFKIGSCAAG